MPPVAPSPTLTWADGRLLRDGEPWQLLAGSIHYFRVHHEQWRDRLRRLVDLGMNTVDTYVAWNFHQPREQTAPDFTGWRDLEGFLAIAQEEGLLAVVRPGPYICAEWANGGFPTWFTGRGIPLRTTDPRFLDPVAAWFDELIPRIARLQAAHGGPVIAVQIENEYGSYGDDPDYIAACRDLLTGRGITELLYTSDGPTEAMVDAGALPGALMALNLGSRPEQARAFQQSLRPGEPFLCGEFWNGWFDHWQHPHHVREADSAMQTLRGLVADGGSVSVYMAHGGTNFGTWAGANDVDGELRATVTSYDSDAPIAEDGTLTPKFFATREVLGRTAPVDSAEPVFAPQQEIAMRPGAPLIRWQGEGTRTTVPCATDALGIDSDLVRFDADVRLPAEPVAVSFADVRDRAHVYLDGRFLGSIEHGGAFTVERRSELSRLTVFAEVNGRINYGHRLGEHKGLLGPVLIDGRRMVQWWQCAGMPLEAPTVPRPDGSASDGEPGFSHGTFTIDSPADAHLALPGFGRGYVWVGDFLLGRYWADGPQRTLYVPAPLLRAGENTITVLEFERPGTGIRLQPTPELGPEEEYIEDF